MLTDNTPITASICMSAYHRPELLRKTLESIYRQQVPFAFEVIVCDDDGSLPDELLEDYPQVQWHRIAREPGVRNAAIARNLAYKAARGEVLICQSEEVLHITDNTIERLVIGLRPNTCLFAKVKALDPIGTPIDLWMGAHRRMPRPFFYLGSVSRADMYAVGGNDEEFIYIGYEDKWLANCLVNGAGLAPIFDDTIIGHHQYHIPCEDIHRNHLLYDQKKALARKTGIWMSSGGPWPMDT